VKLRFSNLKKSLIQFIIQKLGNWIEHIHILTPTQKSSKNALLFGLFSSVLNALPSLWIVSLLVTADAKIITLFNDLISMP
jgi:hypothetical protein